MRTPLLMGYALTIEQIYFFAKPYFRIASYMLATSYMENGIGTGRGKQWQRVREERQ